MRLQRKILLILLPCIIIPMLALGVTAYIKLSATANEKTHSQIETTLDNVEQGVNAYINTAKSNIELFSASSQITRYLLVDDEGERYSLFQPSLLTLMSSYQKAFPHYQEMRVLLPDGYEDTRSTLSSIPNLTEDESKNAYFGRMVRSLGKIHVEFFVNPDTNKMSLLIAKPIMIKDPKKDPALVKPELRGYFVITSTLDFLKGYQKNVHIGVNGRVAFVDGDGKKLFAERTESYPLPANLFATISAAANDNIIRKVEIEREATIVHGRRLDKNLIVFATLPEWELLKGSRIHGVIVALSTILATSFVAIMLFTLLKSLIIKPIQKLSNATREIGKGNLDVRIEVKCDDEIGDLAAAFGQMSTNLQSSTQQVKHMAYFDNLTGLANRYNLTKMIDREIVEKINSKHQMAVLFVDLDDFKQVNDNLGHEAGDLVLKNVADRFTKCVEKDIGSAHQDQCENTVARLGGDEFVILLSRIHDANDAALVANRLVESVSEQFIINNYSFHLSVSVGIAMFPDNGTSADMLIGNADIAMYHAKNDGKNHYQYFSESMNNEARECFMLGNSLRNAIGSDQLLLYYQPLIKVNTGRISTVEALVRWKHPTRGFLMPDEFIPLAEKSGLIVHLGKWVLYQACKQVVAWDKAGYRPVRVAVNISNTQLNSNDFVETVSDVLKNTGLPAHRLELEITESSIMHAEIHTQSTIHELKKLGVLIAMDDFGTGYSSLAALRQLPVDILKIDRSFVDGIAKNKADAKIVSVILAMARLFKLEVVAEGVETTEQLDFLCKEGCDTIQGYLISRPLPAGDIKELFQHRPEIVKTYLQSSVN